MKKKTREKQPTCVDLAHETAGTRVQACQKRSELPTSDVEAFREEEVKSPLDLEKHGKAIEGHLSFKTSIIVIICIFN